MIHYHGTPITPNAVLETELAGRCFCVSFARPDQVALVHRVGQSVMLDNGAFSFWRKKKHMTPAHWVDYYRFAEKWLEHATTWAVIPDVIDGSVAENDALIDQWPFGSRGAPVWHMHEPIERLVELCHRWPRVCVGSSGEYKKVGDLRWRIRMADAMDEVCADGPTPLTWLHMLRGMALSGGPFPFASVDSTDIGRNFKRPQNTARGMAERWDSMQCPPIWIRPRDLPSHS